MDWIYASLGLLILLLAGDSLVRGAVNMSLRLGVPALIVSLTIVAFGTSAPELLISVRAVADGAPDIALGNVVGSNTANILLVLGIPALISVMHTSNCETRKNYLFMMAASVVFVALAFRGIFDWKAGLMLLAGLGLMLADAFLHARSHRRDMAALGVDEADEEEEMEELEGADPDMPWWKIFAYLVLGLIGLPLGADLLVEASTNIARMFGVSEVVIGLTLVAVGTSLPELATTVMAAIRQQADVALGNVIGSNMFNLLAIIGITTLIGPIPVAPEFLEFDLWVMLASSALLFPFVFLKFDISRLWGVILTALYAAYVLAVIA